MSRRKRVYPVVEAVQKRRYKIAEGRGMVDNKGGRMWVPLDDSLAALHIRAHEMAHAKWSPDDPRGPKGVPNVCIQRAEDLRMNVLSRRVGVNALDYPVVEHPLFGEIDGFAQSRLEAITAACSTYNTGDWPILRDLFERVNPALAAEAEDIASRAYAEMEAIEEPSWDDALRLATALAEICKDPESEGGEGGQGGSEEGEGSEGGEGSSGGASEAPPPVPPPSDDDDEDMTEPSPPGDEESPGAGGGEEGEDEGEDETEAGGGDSEGDSEGDGSGKGAESDEESDEEESAGGGSSDGDGSDGESGESEAESGDEDGEGKDGDGGGGAGPVMADDYDDSEMEPVDVRDPAFMVEEESVEEVDDVEASVRAMLDLKRRTNHYRYNDQVIGWEWGEMRTVEPPRVRKLKPRLRGKTRTGFTEGISPAYMNRYCTDGAIFAGKAKRPGGGTVLIDASGSMHLSDEDIDSILERAPAALIAAYNGAGMTGEMRILAKDGRRVRPDQLKPKGGGGNTVDGPALDWLMQQAEPRLWISDGMVFGSSAQNSRHPGLLDDVAAKCRRARILRLGTMGDLRAWLKKTRQDRP